jgi:PTS system fructose-specific IIC component
MGKYLCTLYDLKNSDLIIQKILERESQVSTGIGYGIAIPHARVEGIENIYMIASKLAKGIEYNAIDDQPVHLVFMMVSPLVASVNYTNILSSLSRILSFEEIRKNLLEAEDAEKFLNIIIEAENKHI